MAERSFKSPIQINCLTISLYLGKQDWSEISFQTKVPDLIQHLTEDRLRHARGPVHTLSLLHTYEMNNLIMQFTSPKILLSQVVKS